MIMDIHPLADRTTNRFLGNWYGETVWPESAYEPPPANDPFEGAIWDDKQWAAPVEVVIPDAVIAAEPLQSDLPLDDATIAEVKAVRDDQKTPVTTSALIDFTASLARVFGWSEDELTVLLAALVRQ